MRYEESRRLRGIGSVWLRIRLWFRPAFLQAEPVISDLSHLSDHEQRDIGVPEPIRFMDWRVLTDRRLF